MVVPGGDQPSHRDEPLLDAEDKKGLVRFLTGLALPFVLLAIGGLLLAGGVAVLLIGGPTFIWLGLMILGGVFVLAGVIGFVVLMMMAEAGPF